MISSDAKKELIVDAIQTYAPTFDAVPIKPPPAKGKAAEPQVMVAVLTDTHVGEQVYAPQLMAMNSYDYDIFNRRLSGLGYASIKFGYL